MTTSNDNALPLRDGLEREAVEKPKRFYEDAGYRSAETGFAIILDGRSVRTPGRQLIEVPTRELASALADEWDAQAVHIDPTTMPLTRIVNSALDGVAPRMNEVAADIARYAGSDLLSYRAISPAELVAKQAEAWDPLLGWARDAHRIDLQTTSGVMPIEQSADALEAARRAVGARGPLRLAALHVMTTLSGSLVLALAHAEHHLPLEDAWAAAHVDEDWNIALWGADTMAEKLRAARLRDMTAASFISRYGAVAISV